MTISKLLPANASPDISAAVTNIPAIGIAAIALNVVLLFSVTLVSESINALYALLKLTISNI
jgi:hypothetical protein